MIEDYCWEYDDSNNYDSAFMFVNIKLVIIRISNIKLAAIIRIRQAFIDFN